MAKKNSKVVEEIETKMVGEVVTKVVEEVENIEPITLPRYIANVALKCNGIEIKAGEEFKDFETLLSPRIQKALISLRRVKVV